MEGQAIRNVNHNAIISKAITSLAVVTVLFSASGVANADTLDDQIKAAQAEAAAQSANASNLHAQANNYQEQVNQYRSQIAVVQSQIRLNQSKSAKLNAQIEDAKVKMAEQKAFLAANIKSMYLSSNVSPLEMLVSSGDISSFFNQQQYQDKVKDKIQSAMAEIVKLKADLDKQQADLAKLLADQENQHQQLTATKANLDQLLAVAAQNAAVADNQVKEKNARVATLKAEQAAALAARFRNSNGFASGGACGGGYPAIYCNAEQDSLVDRWGMYNRECVSYTAFKVWQSGRNMPYWGGVGNAKQWPGNAQSRGIPVDGNPKPGDVAISMAGPYGHSMYVESVSGGNVHVSQYNFSNNGQYSEMTIPASGLYFIHFR